MKKIIFLLLVLFLVSCGSKADMSLLTETAIGIGNYSFVEREMTESRYYNYGEGKIVNLKGYEPTITVTIYEGDITLQFGVGYTKNTFPSY